MLGMERMRFKLLWFENRDGVGGVGAVMKE